MAHPGKSRAGGPRRRGVRDAKLHAVAARGRRGEQVDGETLLCARVAKMSDSVQLSKPTALGREESWSSSRPCHPLAPHAILQQRLHGVQHRARDIGMVLHLQHELCQDERGSAAYETNSAWTRRILALSISSGSN